MSKKYLSALIIMLFLLLSCVKSKDLKQEVNNKKNSFILSFASCNNQHLANPLWAPILENDPDVFIWGGDIVYADTYDMKVMNESYVKMKSDSAYQSFSSMVPILGIWDDHDYGVNDGGEEYSKKDSVQQIFLDFFDVDPQDSRRKRKGVYHTTEFDIVGSLIKIILLDTRYFRTKLTKDPEGKKKYIPSTENGNSMLGEEQWHWLEKELTLSKANFNIIISSIQFLSFEHGFESWGNMPNEVLKMKQLLSTSKARGVIILSGDRHLAEISETTLEGLSYPLIDFTSSGMTHSYSSFKGEENKYRISEVVPEKNFGILRFNFKDNMVEMEIRGENNKLFQSHSQKY